MRLIVPTLVILLTACTPRGTEAQSVPQETLPSVPDVPPPDVDTEPLQQPLTLGPFEAGTTATDQTAAAGQETAQTTAPQAATQFAQANTEAVLQRLNDQATLLEERERLLEEREALLEERETLLNERAQYIQEREARAEALLEQQAAAAAVQEDQLTVGEFFTGEAARHAEQFGNRPDQFQPGTDGEGFAPGPEGESFTPGPVDTNRPFFNTIDPPESP